MAKNYVEKRKSIVFLTDKLRHFESSYSERRQRAHKVDGESLGETFSGFVDSASTKPRDKLEIDIVD